LCAISACAVVLACTTDKADSSRDNVPDSSRAAALSDTATRDDFGNELPRDSAFASRVVSLNPTATEIIFTLGQASRLVGRSSWDEFPEEAKAVTAVGNGIRPNLEAVLALRPTLVVLYATGENREAANALQHAGIRTLALRVDRIEQFEHLTLTLALALGVPQRGREVVDSVMRTLNAVRAVVKDAARPHVVWPLWSSPVMVVGGGSYLDQLLDIAGAENVFRDSPSPSPQVSIEEIARRDPSFVLAGDAGSGEFAKTPAWNAVNAVRLGHVRRIDSRLTGRPSVNLGMAAVSLARVIHPELSSRLP
jgi:ABC-type Fe3+-hydroxamate transport system substrate-binding protein